MAIPAEPKRLDITVVKGKTFKLVVTWEKEPRVYKAITAITRGGPARLTVAAHGVPDGWRVAVVGVGGMTQLNAKHSPPEDDEFYRATRVDENTIEFNDVPTGAFNAYTTGGHIMYNTPALQAGCTARMTIRDRVGGTAMHEMTSEAGDIVLDAVTKKTITLLISADDTAALAVSKGVYDLELITPDEGDGDDEVTGLLFGTVSIKPEVTT